MLTLRWATALFDGYVHRLFSLHFPKKSFFGKSHRASDYAQAIMEIGALVCKPLNPECKECPISKECLSYKNNNFEINSILKFNKIKYFEVKIFQNKSKKFYLVKNSKFNFLKKLFSIKDYIFFLEIKIFICIN